MNEMYQSGDVVEFKQPRCSCMGGGFEFKIGTVSGLLQPGWFKIDVPGNTLVVQSDNIVKKINT